MARIYESNFSEGNLFQGSQQSVGFNPVRAVDTSAQEKIKAQQAVANIKTLGDQYNRQHSVNQADLSAQRARTNAEMTSKANAVKGLLSLSQTALKGFAMADQMAKQRAQEDSYLDAIGFNEATPAPRQESFEQAKDIDTQVNTESQAIGQVANEVEASGTLEDKSVAHQLRQGSAYQMTAGIRGNVYQARAGHAAFLQQALLEIPDAEKPRTYPEAQQLLQELNREFLKGSGLFGTNRSVVARELAPTMMTNNQNLIGQLVNAGIKADRAANLTQLQSNIYTAVSSDMSAEEVWKVASEGFAQGNVGHTGFSAASNEAAVKQIINSAIQDGDVALLEQLAETPKMGTQPNGPKLGDEYAHLLGPAIAAARKGRAETIRAQRSEIGMQAKQAVQSYYDNPSGESKARLIETLQRMPQTEQVRSELNKLTSKGFNNDPELEAELAARAARGDYISQDELKSALDKGLIRPEVYKQHALTQGDIKVNQKAGEVTKELKPFIEQSLLGGVSMRDLPATTRTVFNMRVKMFQDELSQALAAEARSNPAILDNIQERNNLATQLMQQMAGRPEYTLTNDPKIGVKFQADPGTRSAEVQGLTIAPGEQDFRGISREAVLKNVPRSEISASDDLLLSAESLNLDVNNILRGEKVSPNTRSWARSLGMSERAFIDAQLERNGKPSLSLLESQSPKAAEPGADLNAESGFQHLQSMGFPVRGAAYITSAISHESTWVGMREWGQVAGDGTNRNGGLISWASWHDNSARLGAIERHFGRNIAFITETEQLDYMQYEMRTRYPKAYRIFNNPNASSADLRWAVSNYWGFDPRYTGNRWVDAEDLIKRS